MSGIIRAMRNGFVAVSIWCKKLDAEILSTDAVEQFLQRVVKVRIDPEAGAEERAIAARFGVRGYPSVFVSGDPGAMTPAEFVAACVQAGARAN